MAPERQKVIQSAEKMVARGRIQAAIDEYRKVLERHPNDTSTLNRVGDLFARLNKMPKAIELFQQTAESFGKQGFFVKAIAIYKKIIRLDPGQIRAYEALADLYNRQGLTGDSLAQYQVVADYYEKHDDQSAALGVYENMVGIEPNNPSRRLKLAAMLQSQDLLSKALEQYYEIASLMLSHSRGEEALQVLIGALDVDAKDLEFVERALVALKESGFDALATKLLHTAIGKNPLARNLEAEFSALPAGEAQAVEPEPVAAEPEPEVEAAPEPTPEEVAATLDEIESAEEVDLPEILEEEDVEHEAEAEVVAEAEEIEASSEVEFELDPSEIELEVEADIEVAAEADLDGRATIALPTPPQEAGEAGLTEVELEADVELEVEDEVEVEAAVEVETEVEAEPDELEIDLEIEYDDVPEAVAEAVEVEEPEVAGEAVAVDEPEAVEETIAADEPEAVEEAIAVDEPEVVEESAGVEEPEIVTEAIDEPQVIEEVGTVDEPEAVEEAVAVEEPEAAEAQVEVDEPEVVEEPVAVDEPAVSEGPEAVEESVEEPDRRPEVVAEAPAPAPKMADLAVSGESIKLLIEAEVLTRYGMNDMAIAVLERVLEADPEHSEALARLTKLQIRNEQLDEAVVSANRLAGLVAARGEPKSWSEVREMLEERGVRFSSGVFVAPKVEEPEPVAEVEVEQTLEVEAEAAPVEEAATDEPVAAGEPEVEAPGADADLDFVLEEIGAEPEAVAPAPVEEAPEPPEISEEAIEQLVEEVTQEESPQAPVQFTEDVLAGVIEEIERGVPEPTGADTAGSAVEAPVRDAEKDLDWLRELESSKSEPEPEDEPSDGFGDDFVDLATELEAELVEAGDLDDELLPNLGEQSLEDIVEGFRQGMAETLSDEDFDTHYNLGVAYREMGLIDEAIGEFQMAAKDPRYLVECCSLLAASFVDKEFYDLAIQWYEKGIDSPVIDEESRLGLLYELGTLLIGTGQANEARQRFLEIYGLNSNYRDVVARLEELG